MGYKNTASTAYEVERCLSCSGGSDYNINSHGDLGAHYNHLMNSDLPLYTAMMYHPSQHELFSELKYDRVLGNYDSNLNQIKENIRGPSMEDYIPPTMFLPEAGNSNIVPIREAAVAPKQHIVDEILKAQAEVTGRNPVEQIIIRATEIEQEIYLKRKISKLEIFKKPQL